MYLSNASHKSLVAISLLLLCITACSVLPSKVSSDVPSVDSSAAGLKKAVARVNGKEITRADLNQAKRVILASKPGLQIPPLLQKDFEMQALNQLISAELLFQASQKLEIRDLDRQAEVKLAEIRKRFTDPKAYERELEKIGVDEKGLLESTRRDLAIAYFVNTTIAPGIKVSEEEIKAFYEQNPDKFLIKPADGKEPEKIPLSAARERIESYLRVQKTNAAIEAFVGEARKSAKVEVML